LKIYFFVVQARASGRGAASLHHQHLAANEGAASELKAIEEPGPTALRELSSLPMIAARSVIIGLAFQDL
jgi:hypothetical protein